MAGYYINQTLSRFLVSSHLQGENMKKLSYENQRAIRSGVNELTDAHVQVKQRNVLFIPVKFNTCRLWIYKTGRGLRFTVKTGWRFHHGIIRSECDFAHAIGSVADLDRAMSAIRNIAV